MSRSGLLPLGSAATRTAHAGARLGAKAAGLARARHAGLPVLPGWVLPVAAGAAALGAGQAELRAGRPAAARRAVLGHPFDAGLADALHAAVAGLGGRVIVRSSSPLEADGRWAGAFSSVAEVGPADAAAAVRSCWASAFAVDPLGRLDASGLGVGDLRLGVVVQPEIRPDAGGVARVEWDEVIIDGVAGHPADLLGGWAEGATERWPLAAGAAGPARGPLATLVGPGLVAGVARLARDCHRDLGDDLIEWAACGDQVWLLQSRSTAAPRAGRAGTGGGRCPGPAPADPVLADPVLADPALADPALAGQLLAMLTAVDRPADPAARVRWMPFIATIVLAHGQHVAGRPAAPGLAAGRLVPVRPHAPAAASHLGAVLLVDHPHPALAPLLFAARAVVARRGAAGSHLADVARSLGVPMVTGCPLDEVDPLDRPGGDGPGTGQPWLAAVDGSSGDVAVLPG